METARSPPAKSVMQEPRKGAASSYPVPLDELLGDDDALHLVRSFADAEQRRIPVKALDREFLRVAVAAMNPQRFMGILEGRLGGEVFRHAGLHVAALAAVVDLGCIPDQQTRGFHTSRHLSQLELDRLVLADRLAESLPLLRILDRFRQRPGSDAHAARRDVYAAELEPAHGLPEPAALLADEIARGDAVILEHELR